MKDILLKTIERDCPFCDKIHVIELRERDSQALVKNEVVEYAEQYFLCPNTLEDDNEFVAADMLDDNLLRARNSYRMSHGLLTTTQIADIRAYYGITQSDFSAMLGWGDVTVTRYESKSIQDETYDKMMRMAHQNPMFALACLDAHKNRFDAQRYEGIRKRIIRKVEEIGNTYFKKQEILSKYVNYEEASDVNGYKPLDIQKTANVMGYFAQFMDYLYKVKLMKLLWYADVLHFARHHVSMTGMVYLRKSLGALPIGDEELLSLPTIQVIEELMYEDTSFRILPLQEVNLSAFTFEELSVLEAVTSKFKEIKTKDIVSYMHREMAYMNTEPNQVISYSRAVPLNELK